MPSRTYIRPRPASNGVKIRRATSKDMPAIIEIIGEFPDKLMQNHLPRARAFIVATEGEHVVGCCALEIYSKRLAEIRSLAVMQDYQHQGIAKQLIRTCISAAKKNGVYEILCITGARDFFERYGFGTFNKEKYALIKVLRDQPESGQVNNSV
jgi:amino-acid N-acetyltransferase